MTDVLVLDYPPAYVGPRPIEQQIREIAWRFGLSPKEALAHIGRGLPQLPAGAEGWFAIPSVDALATQHFSKVTDPAERYRRAVERAFRVLGVAHDFADQSAIKMIVPSLRQDELSVHAWALVTRDQPGEIVIIAAQLGRLHRGQAVGRVTYAEREYGFGAFEAAVVLLTHPTRLVGPESLDLDCFGDTCALGEGGKVVAAPSFSHTGEGIVGGSGWRGQANGRNGPATWFLG